MPDSMPNYMFDSVPETYALTQALPFDGESFLPGRAVLICGDRIQALIAEDDIEPNITRIPLQGAVIAPGFIDLQLNGCGGVMFNDAITPASLETMHAANLKSGCTSFLPTLITTTDEDMLEAMCATAAFRSDPHRAVSVLGLHLEGPYISKFRKGIHDERFIRPLDQAMRGALADFARHTPLMLTLAPECVSEQDLRFLVAAGVHVSIGHSAATYEQAKASLKAGVRTATHLFNAMPPWQSREPGIIGAIYDSPDCSCGMIADGHHSHWTSLRLSKLLKGEKCFLVTDATSPVGTDMTEFIFGGQTVYVRDDMCVNKDGTLGGSLLTMIRAVQNSITYIGWDPAEVLRMASLYPARIMGVDDRLGKIESGFTASLAVYNPYTYDMVAVVDRGRLSAL